MALKFSRYWPGYETLAFKRHGDKFLFSPPPLFRKTYLVTFEQRDALAEKIRRAYTVDYFQGWLIPLLALVLFPLLFFFVLSGTIGQGWFYVALVAFGIGMFLLPDLIFVLSLNSSILPIVNEAPVSEIKFSRGDWMRNRAFAMPDSRFAYELGFRAVGEVVALNYVFTRSDDLIRLLADIFSAKLEAIALALMLIAAVALPWQMFQLIRLRWSRSRAA